MLQMNMGMENAATLADEESGTVEKVASRHKWKAKMNLSVAKRYPF